MQVQTKLYCENCGKKTLHARNQLDSAIVVVLVILTGGLFLIAWLILSAIQGSNPWRCQTCGTLKKPEVTGPALGGIPVLPQVPKRQLVKAVVMAVVTVVFVLILVLLAYFLTQ